MHVEFQFDVRTVALFIAMTFFVQATAIGAQAFLIRELRQYRGVTAALISNLCLAAGLLLRLFADRLPEMLTTMPANVLILAGPAFCYVALGQFTGLGYSRALIGTVLGICVLSLLYFTYVDANIGMRTVIISIGMAVMVALLLYQLWRISHSSLRFSANLMLIPFLIYGLFLIVRTISLAINPPQDAFSNTPVQSATYLLSFALSFFWSNGFILMVSQRLRNDLMEAATIDVLTKISNRRATQQFLEKELSRTRRNQSEFLVLLIDIDNFKQVNDRWGHSVGDHVLAQTASIFQSMIRKQDWVGRWGGEEFLMIVSGDCAAEALAERVRREIARARYSHGAVTFGITISIGIACARQADEIDQLLKRADMALYQAKQTKNAVSVAD